MLGPDSVLNWSLVEFSDWLNFCFCTSKAIPLDSILVALPELFELELIAPPALEIPLKVRAASLAV